jgi:hypothetical protein
MSRPRVGHAKPGRGTVRFNPQLWARIQAYIDQHPEEGFETPSEFVRGIVRYYLWQQEGHREFDALAQAILAASQQREAPGRSKNRAGDD